MSNYGFDISEYSEKEEKCKSLLASYLKQGCLGLVLGAGASAPMGLPKWHKLVENCLQQKDSTATVDENLDTAELKKIISKLKQGYSKSDYLKLVRDKLYEGVSFDFSTANKELLIALTSLFVGKIRGNVQNVITYNFDSILEWYLMTNGLSVNVTKHSNLFKRYSDVEVTHLHGFLPHNSEIGDMSDDIIFSKEDFEDRKTQVTYWKVSMEEFYRHNVFLTIGMSPQSILDDICPFLRATNQWYEQEKLTRTQPYGIAYMTPLKSTDDREYIVSSMIRDGIIPCFIERDKIPQSIFAISQLALKL